mgnify:CR=1 FL=1
MNFHQDIKTLFGVHGQMKHAVRFQDPVYMPRTEIDTFKGGFCLVVYVQGVTKRKIVEFSYLTLSTKNPKHSLVTEINEVFRRERNSWSN